jgi:hypothetical protein
MTLLFLFVPEGSEEGVRKASRIERLLGEFRNGLLNLNSVHFLKPH